MTHFVFPHPLFIIPAIWLYYSIWTWFHFDTLIQQTKEISKSSDDLTSYQIDEFKKPYTKLFLVIITPPIDLFLRIKDLFTGKK
jgi:hypothetical protein